MPGLRYILRNSLLSVSLLVSGSAVSYASGSRTLTMLEQNKALTLKEVAKEMLDYGEINFNQYAMIEIIFENYNQFVGGFEVLAQNVANAIVIDNTQEFERLLESEYASTMMRELISNKVTESDLRRDSDRYARDCADNEVDIAARVKGSGWGVKVDASASFKEKSYEEKVRHNKNAISQYSKEIVNQAMQEKSSVESKMKDFHREHRTGQDADVAKKLIELFSESERFKNQLVARVLDYLIPAPSGPDDGYLEQDAVLMYDLKLSKYGRLNGRRVRPEGEMMYTRKPEMQKRYHSQAVRDKAVSAKLAEEIWKNGYYIVLIKSESGSRTGVDIVPRGN